MLLLTDCRQALALIVEAIATVSKWMGLLSWALFNLQSLNYAYPFKVRPLSHSLSPPPACWSSPPFLLLCIYILYDLFLKYIFKCIS